MSKSKMGSVGEICLAVQERVAKKNRIDLARIRAYFIPNSAVEVIHGFLRIAPTAVFHS